MTLEGFDLNLACLEGAERDLFIVGIDFMRMAVVFVFLFTASTQNSGEEEGWYYQCIFHFS